MAKHLNYKEDIENREEEQFRKFYDFYRDNYRKIMVVLVLILLFGVARRYYKEYQTKKMIVQMVQEKIEEMKQEENNDIVENNDVPDYTQMFNNFSMDGVIEYMDENEDIKNLFSKEEYDELMKMLKSLDGLYDFFSNSE